MPDFTNWIMAATDEPVAEEVFLPENYSRLPYIVFVDNEDHGGADGYNNLIKHQLTIRRFSETGDRNTQLDTLLDSAGIKFSYEKMWDSENGWYEEVYYCSTTIPERKI